MRFPAVITRLEFPVAELSALRLDGEAFALDEAVIAVDEPELAVNRARALLALLDRRMIVELDSALWVHGCLPEPPRIHTLAIRRDARGRLVPTTRTRLRETAVPDDQLLELGGVRVTNAPRTVVDLALQASVTPERQEGARLLCAAPLVAAQAITLAIHLGHTPGKLRALERIRGWSRRPTASGAEDDRVDGAEGASPR